MDVGLVCDACSAFNEMGGSVCIGCHAPLSLDGGAPSASPSAPPRAVSPANCDRCGAGIVEGNRFCGACGNPLGPAEPPPPAPAPVATPSMPSKGGKQTLFFSTMQAAKAKLVLIRGEGHDGESYTLAGDEHRVGRSDADIVFDEDPFLSPTHANFYYSNGKLVVADEGSINGVYIRIRGTHSIEWNDRFLVGEQVMEVRKLGIDGQAPTPRSDGTYFYSSPKGEWRFALAQILQGGAVGLVQMGDTEFVSLGREDNDINFPEDPFISGHHAQVACKDGALTLTDLGSKNGTFLRINKETILEHGDYVFMGQQLLRVEIV